MSNATDRFKLPFILPGQAQKEVYHNEALTRIDAVLHLAVEAISGVPPADPILGQSWLVAVGASGAWSGKETQVATWTEGGWRFVGPTNGMLAWNKASHYWNYFGPSGWSDGDLPASRIVIDGQQIVGERQSAIASPSGGTIIDLEARAAVDALIATLISHGLTD